MSYSIYGLIGGKEVVEAFIKDYPSAKQFSLSSNLQLVPLTEEIFDNMTESIPSPKTGNFIHLNEKINNLLKFYSNIGMIAYIEADYFGGSGGQSSVVWEHGKLLLLQDFELHNKYIAINKALALFGIKGRLNRDAFDVSGLGKHRSVEDWLEE